MFILHCPACTCPNVFIFLLPKHLKMSTANEKHAIYCLNQCMGMVMCASHYIMNMLEHVTNGQPAGTNVHAC